MSRRALAEARLVERSGREWQLRISIWYPESQTVGRDDRLADASIEEKLSAIEAFPKLLAELKAAQEARLRSASQAIQQFDTFAGSLGIQIEPPPPPPVISTKPQKGGK
jgi:hypothetical protein